MADFVQTMKDWRRMCKAFNTDDESCCYGCPVVDIHEHGCEAIFEMEDGTDWERYEGQIREWAAEHPEPVYPTWKEYLKKIGAVKVKAVESVGYCGNTEVRDTEYVFEVLDIPISADTAQKLGLEPKEG